MKLLVSTFSAIALFSAIATSRALELTADGAASVYQFLAGPRSTLYVMNESPTVPGHAFDSYIHFDLSAFEGTLVESATLRLRTDANTAANFMKNFGGVNPPPAESFFTLSDAGAVWFDENGAPKSTLNWDNRPQSGTVFATPVSFHFTSDGSGGYLNSWVEVDVTSLVNYWLQNPGSNYGFRLSAMAESVFSTAAFVGTDGGELAPQLVVTTAVPEPGTWGLLGMGGTLALTATLRRRRIARNS